MKINKIIFLLSLLLVVGFVSSVEDNLPEPGILPDSAFYGLKRAFEGIGNMFSFREEAKLQRALELSERRLAEVKAVAENNKSEYLERLSEDYNKNIERARGIALGAREERKEELHERVANATLRHIKVLDKVYEKVPEKARERIANARQNSIKGNKEALRGLAEKNPEKAAEIAMRAAESRLKRAGNVVDEDSHEANKSIEDYEGYERFGNEISEIARQIKGNSSKVDELLSRIRQRHTQRLREVQEKIPEKARERIRNVIEEQIRKRENKSRDASEENEEMNNSNSRRDNLDEVMSQTGRRD